MPTSVVVSSPTPTAVTAGPSDAGATLLVERHAREVTLRVRSVECGGLGIGSAVAIAPRLLATNRHVVDSAQQLEIQTWDGRAVRVRAIETAQYQDLGLVRVDVDLPAVAANAGDAAIGESVSAVGYPEGGRFQRSPGIVVDYVEGIPFGQATRVMRVTIPLRHGNSGGAVLNQRGEMVGIAFGIEIATGYGLVIPASSLETAIREAAFSPASGSC